MYIDTSTTFGIIALVFVTLSTIQVKIPQLKLHKQFSIFATAIIGIGIFMFMKNETKKDKKRLNYEEPDDFAKAYQELARKEQEQKQKEIQHNAKDDKKVE